MIIIRNFGGSQIQRSIHVINGHIAVNFFRSNSSRGIPNPFQKHTAASATNRRSEFENSTADNSRSERLFLIAQNDPDRFGAHKTPGTPIENPFIAEEDAGDREEEEYLKNPPSRFQRLSTKQYADIIKEHFRNKRVKEAIDVLEVRMLKEDRVKPENYIYNLLISECARFGYSKKAFGLFTRMKQRNLKVTGATYTALFNACSNTPWLQDGLDKARHLRQMMIDKGYEPNATNYNVMIKAFGRGGDIATAFDLVDEMQTKRLPVDVQTFNFLLQACASDEQLGFRHALLVWHKMLRRRMVPDIYSFNLMLRCVKECGMGDLDTSKEVIEQILLASNKQVEDIPRLEANSQQNMLLISGDPKTQSQLLPDMSNKETNQELINKNHSILASLPTDVHKLETPNLLSRLPHLGSLMALAEVKKPEDRLLLLGGASGVLNEMSLAKVKPDIKTFTQLVEVLPSTNAAEKKLLAALKRLEIKCDIDFFNVLIKKRCLRFQYEGAKEVLGLIKTADLKPDIVTYGVMAMGCRTAEDADELLQEMYLKGIRMNIQILGAMLRQGCATQNFTYIVKILNIVKTENIKPNDVFLRHIDSFCKDCNKVKRNEPFNRTFKREFSNFSRELDNWREFMGLNNATIDDAVKIVRDHPWEQFKYDQPEGMEPVKNPKLRHTKKLTRHIQRIKPENLAGDEERLKLDIDRLK